MDKIQEFKFPTLAKFATIATQSPKNIQTAKIVYEFDGSFKHGDSVYNGTYYVYNDSSMPTKFIGSFVRNDITEEEVEVGTNPVHVVTMDSSKLKVLSRMRQRNKISKRVS